MPAYGSLDQAIAGLVINDYDSIETLVCADASGIVFGAPVYTIPGTDGKGYNYSSGRKYRGVAVFTQKEYAGAAKYNQTEAIPVLRAGLIWVYVGAAVNSDVAAYWDNTNGYWTSTVGSNQATPNYFRSSTSAAGLAILDVVKSVTAAAV